MTPEKTLNCSKRSWDGLVRSWRRRLHLYDPPLEEMANWESKRRLLEGKRPDMSEKETSMFESSDV